MDGDKIKHLTEDQIFSEYYNFTKEQKYIGVKTQNFNSELLCKVALQLIQYGKTIKISTLMEDYFVLFQDQKCLKLIIKSNWFAQGCFNILNNLRPLSLNIEIKYTLLIENQISCFIFQNFDLIPFLQIYFRDNFSMELINKIKSETLRFIAYSKIQSTNMTVNPEQVYFDLLDF